MLEERRLRTFAAVAEAGSIARAAEKLGYTPPAVSQQLAALERHLNCRLFDRGPRGAHLTEAGRILLAVARDLLDRLDVAEATALRLGRTQLGPLTIAAFASAGWKLVPKAFALLRERHPRLRHFLVEADPPDSLAMLKAGEVDLVITATCDGVPTLPESALEFHPLLDDPFLIALPEGHVLAHRESLALTELTDDSWIAGMPESMCTRAMVNACHVAGFDPDVQLNVSDFTTICGMVAAGFGIALVPALAVPTARPGVRYIPLKDGLARHISAVTRPHTTHSPSALLADALELFRAAANEEVLHQADQRRDQRASPS
ncbi:LysR family transcriptional regulator [Nonomuraea typhae]|uniref:LysR family transcriptional regulator n=1 Tax=Nonomuraea typhae TaxID=2603600 RepID=A0ABW7ZA38_9ACTN